MMAQVPIYIGSILRSYLHFISFSEILTYRDFHEISRAESASPEDTQNIRIRTSRLVPPYQWIYYLYRYIFI